MSHNQILHEIKLTQLIPLLFPLFSSHFKLIKNSLLQQFLMMFGDLFCFHDVVYELMESLIQQWVNLFIQKFERSLSGFFSFVLVSLLLYHAKQIQIMKKSYMDVFEQITHQKLSTFKKERLKLLKIRPYQRHKSIDNMQSVKEPEPIKPKQNRVAYIDNAIKIMRESERILQQNPSLPIRIDNAYGDYAMSMFRRKDKKKRLEDIPKLFTNQFQSKILDCFPPGCDRLVDDLIKGKVRASSLISQPSQKLQGLSTSERKKRNLYKDLEELNEEMRYEYFAEEESFGGYKAKTHEKEDQMRASSMDRLMQHKPEGLLPPINKVRKGLIFKSQTHPLNNM